MTILKITLKIVLVLAIIFIGFLSYIIITDYRPEEIIPSDIINDNEVVINGDTFTVTTYNIGYCGLDKNQDFFLDGGTTSRTSSEAQSLMNLTSVSDFILNTNSDFYFLQEVDESGDRSADVNQLKYLTETYSNLSSSFSYNFKAPWIPIPVTKPMGSAYSGLLNFSNFSITESNRLSLPVDESFPNKFFDLDRSIMEDVYDLGNGKTLYMVNIHFSAYDKGGLVRAEQAQFLVDYINERYNENTYIVFGGDWNHLLDPDLYTDDMPEWVHMLPEELFETGFKLAYDNTVNTVRSDDQPYVKGENFETVIDGFLISPNIEIVLVEGHALDFENSDHNPVTLTFRLK